MALPPTFTVQDSIEEAFERCGVDPKGITGEHVESASRSITLLLSAWNNDSVDFWKVVSGSTHLQTVEEQQWTLPDDCVDVLSIGVLRDQYLTPMLLISRDDWFSLPDRALASGMATRLWTERLISSVTAHVYPMAENSTDVLVFDYMQLFQDSTILQGSPDVPPLWLAAFVDGLTFFLSRKFDRANILQHAAIYGGPGTPEYPIKCTGTYAAARMGNRERADTVMIKHKARRLRR